MAMRSKKDFKAFWSFMTNPRNVFLFPILGLLIVIGIFILVAQSSAIAPLIYTLF